MFNEFIWNCKIPQKALITNHGLHVNVVLYNQFKIMKNTISGELLLLDPRNAPKGSSNLYNKSVVPHVRLNC